MVQGVLVIERSPNPGMTSALAIATRRSSPCARSVYDRAHCGMRRRGRVGLFRWREPGLRWNRSKGSRRLCREALCRSQLALARTSWRLPRSSVCYSPAMNRWSVFANETIRCIDLLMVIMLDELCVRG